MNFPKVSIIVPVFNTDLYIAKCLDSLCQQTLREIEIVVVNDGSTDNSDSIIRSYLKDNRIKYIYLSDNKGTFYARTVGLFNSIGTFIATVDSDDWVDKYAFEKMYNSAILHNVDIVECKFWAVDDSTLQLSTFRWADHSLKTLSGESILKNVLKRKIWHIAANKIFHKKLVEKSIWFYKSVDSKIIVADDKLLTIPMFFYSKKYFSMPDRLYYYRQRNNSSTNNRTLEHDIIHIRDTYNVDKYLLGFFEKEKCVSFIEDFKSNAAAEIRLIFKNITEYNEDSYERDRLYSEVMRYYGLDSLKFLHGELENFIISNSDKKNIEKIIKKLKKCFFITIKNIIFLLKEAYHISFYHSQHTKKQI